MLMKQKPVRCGGGVSEATQEAKAPAAKPNDPSSIPGTHVVKPSVSVNLASIMCMWHMF